MCSRHFLNGDPKRLYSPKKMTINFDPQHPYVFHGSSSYAHGPIVPSIGEPVTIELPQCE